MKKIITNLLFLFCGIVATTASGQSTFSRLSPGSSGQATFSGLSKDYTQSMDSLLLFVNKAPVTTSILYDRIQPFAFLSRLKENGQMTKTTTKNFVQAWSELYRASFNPTFGNVEVLKNSIKTNTDPSSVDIGVINTKINYIDFGTPTQPSLTMQGGYLRNVPNVNPFLEKQVTMVAALKEIATGNQISFTLKPEFLLQYIGVKIQTLQADFGTGTLFTLVSNQVINANPAVVTYTSSGLKTIVFTIVFENNSTETLQSTLNVNVPVNTSMMRGGFPLEEDFVGTESITASIPFQGYNEATATAGTLEYRTYYSKVVNDGSAKSRITKPIIILDGYDPEDSRKIYSGSLNYDSTKNSIYGLMEFDPDNNPLTDNSENLVKKLRAAPYGFDVTLVNFPKGADYIERNAMALVSLLARENLKLSHNGSTEQVSIIGPSMGGLVSRYALAYMEKNNIPHNTKLWVSFDSPHLGANIPISAQENIYFFGYNAKQDEAYEKFKTNFFSPAARQMLIEQLDGTQLDGDTFTQNPNLFFPQLYGPNNTTRFRQLFTTALNNNGLPNSNGYPQNMRKIAIVNGTTNGAKNFSEGQKYLDLAAFISIKWGRIFGTEFITSIKMTAFENNFLPITNMWGPSFKGTAFIKKDVAVVGASVRRKNINPRGSMDVVPGGTFAIGDNIKDSFDKAFESLPIVNDIQWRTNFKYNTFIPTISSLGFKNSDFDWSTPVNSNLVCEANTQINFDSYYAPTTNEDHVKITAESATWLLEELKGNPQAPHFPIQDNALSGNNFVCLNQVSTFSIEDACQVPSPVMFTSANGTAINGWSVEGNLVIVSSTAYGVTVKSSSVGAGKVIATFQNGQKFVKNVMVIGAPPLPQLLSYSNIPYDSTLQNGPYWDPIWLFNARDPNAAVTEFVFKDLNENILVTKNVNNGVVEVSASELRIRPGSTSSFYVYPKNQCGEIVSPKKRVLQFTLYNPTLCQHGFGSGCNMQRIGGVADSTVFMIFPNPATDIINIELRSKIEKPDNKADITAILYNLMGQEKAKIKINNNKASIPTATLPKGLYVLQIDIDGNIETHHIGLE